MNVRESLVALLRTSPDLVRACGLRFYHRAVPSSLDQFPCVVYHRTGGTSVKTLQGSSGLRQARFQLDCYALRSAESAAMADAVAALEGPCPSGTGLQWLVHEDESDDLEEPSEGQEKGLGLARVDVTVWY